MFKYGYCSKCFTVRELVASCDKIMFNSASNQSHCLNQLFQYKEVGISAHRSDVPEVTILCRTRNKDNVYILVHVHPTIGVGVADGVLVTSPPAAKRRHST